MSNTYAAKRHEKLACVFLETMAYELQVTGLPQCLGRGECGRGAGSPKGACSLPWWVVKSAGKAGPILAPFLGGAIANAIASKGRSGGLYINTPETPRHTCSHSENSLHMSIGTG